MFSTDASQAACLLSQAASPRLRTRLRRRSAFTGHFPLIRGGVEKRCINSSRIRINNNNNILEAAARRSAAPHSKEGARGCRLCLVGANSWNSLRHTAGWPAAAASIPVSLYPWRNENSRRQHLRARPHKNALQANLRWQLDRGIYQPKRFSSTRNTLEEADEEEEEGDA